MGLIEKRNTKKRVLAVDDTAIVLTRILNTLQEDYTVVTVNLEWDRDIKGNTQYGRAGRYTSDYAYWRGGERDCAKER